MSDVNSKFDDKVKTDNSKKSGNGFLFATLCGAAFAGMMGLAAEIILKFGNLTDDMARHIGLVNFGTNIAGGLLWPMVVILAIKGMRK